MWQSLHDAWWRLATLDCPHSFPGGQNPLEATSLGKPVIFGPSMHNFKAIAHQLLVHHAARQAVDGHEFAALLVELVERPEEARDMGRRAQELTERFQGATQRTLNALQPLLARSSQRRPDAVVMS